MPETTPRGYPVPLLSDAVDDGAGHLNAFWDLASAIDADVTASSGVTVLDRSTSSVAVVNTLVETDLYRATIPANALGTNGGLRLALAGDLLNNTASGPYYRLKVKFGATTLFDMGGTAAGVLQPPNSATRAFWDLELLLENGAAAAQAARVAIRGAGTSGSAATFVQLGTFASLIGNTVATEDTTAAKDLAVTVTMSVANASIDIRRRLVLLEKVNHT